MNMAFDWWRSLKDPGRARAREERLRLEALQNFAWLCHMADNGRIAFYWGVTQRSLEATV